MKYERFSLKGVGESLGESQECRTLRDSNPFSLARGSPCVIGCARPVRKMQKCSHEEEAIYVALRFFGGSDNRRHLAHE